MGDTATRQAAEATQVRTEDLYRHPNALAPLYSHFRLDAEPTAEHPLRLTGHSHQAWPDVAREGMLRAYDDAARLVDDKWSRAFEMAQRVVQGYARLLDDVGDGEAAGSYTLASNTHELVVRFLSALPLAERPRLITTDGEFHSIRRQLDRLAEEGVEVVKLDARDPGTLAERLAAQVDDRTAAVLVSSVLFQSARIVPGLALVLTACQKHGAELLVDTYHAIDAIPFSLRREGLEGAYAVGGGYKYCQLGEGNCFLRVPPHCTLRPVITGWFAEFHLLADAPTDRVAYGEGACRFAGATYDPTSHYRGAAVLDFFEARGLTPELLREVSQHQVALLRDAIDALDPDPALIRRDDVPLSELAGFLVLETPRAGELCQALRQRGIATDYRGRHLRFGPAPYLSDRQLHDAVARLGEVLRTLPREAA